MSLGTMYESMNKKGRKGKRYLSVKEKSRGTETKEQGYINERAFILLNVHS